MVFKAGLPEPTENNISWSLQDFGTDIRRPVRFSYSEAPEEFVQQSYVSSFIDEVKDVELQQA